MQTNISLKLKIITFVYDFHKLSGNIKPLSHHQEVALQSTRVQIDRLTMDGSAEWNIECDESGDV